MKKRQKAFTIVELVIVIAVIAILAAVLIPTFSTVIRKAKDSYFLQNKRNEALEDFADSILDEDYVTAEDKIANDQNNNDPKIEEIKKDLNALFEYIVTNKQVVTEYSDDIDWVVKNVKHGFFESCEGYSYVGWFGYGNTKEVYSYKGKYIIQCSYPTTLLLSFKIRFYDDIIPTSDMTQLDDEIISPQSSVYYRLKANKKGDETDENGKPKYEIEVIKYVEPQN